MEVGKKIRKQVKTDSVPSSSVTSVLIRSEWSQTVSTAPGNSPSRRRRSVTLVLSTKSGLFSKKIKEGQVSFIGWRFQFRDHCHDFYPRLSDQRPKGGSNVLHFIPYLTTRRSTDTSPPASRCLPLRRSPAEKTLQKTYKNRDRGTNDWVSSRDWR